MAASSTVTSRWGAWSHRARSRGLAAERRAAWLRSPSDYGRGRLAGPAKAYPFEVWRAEIPLVRHDAGLTQLFEDGKRHNVALAAPALDGLLLDPDETFSFWRTVGAPTAARGFDVGMELRGGCVIPSVGGGICLLTNALFRLAVETGATIVERHGHSLTAVPPLPGETWGLDATAAYPHLDLRFRPPAPMRLAVEASSDVLAIRATAAAPLVGATFVTSEADQVLRDAEGHQVRTNRLRRLQYSAGGTLVGDEVVAENRKRIVAAEEAQRSCLNCNEVNCHTRPAGPLHLMAPRARPRRP